MATEIKKLLGNRVYVSIPKKDETKLIVDENTKEALNRELLAKMSKLTVYAVGTGIEESVLKEGDQILVDPNKLKEALLVPLSDTNTVMLITIFDIVHIWS
jgi:ABC-type Na+ efflux pump permease subunit